MYTRSILTALLIILATISMTSCDMFENTPRSTTPESPDVPSLMLRDIPFPTQTDFRTSLNDKGLTNEPEFTLSISSLASEDKKEPYFYNRYELFFPAEVVAAAGGKSWNRKVNITTTEELRGDAALTQSNETVVRVARMHIPASEVAFEMALQQLGRFIAGSFIEDWQGTIGGDIPEEDEEEGDVSGRFVCTEYFVQTTCILDEDGNIDDATCRVTNIVCNVWELIDPGGDGDDGGGTPENPDDPNDPGEPGGGTPPIGDDGDPCDQFDDDEGDDNDNPGGGHDNDEDFLPRMIECDECDFPNPPAWCPVDDEEEEPEPCDTGYGFIDDPNIQQVLQTLWENSNYGNRENPNPDSTRVEQGGYLVPNPWGDGGYTFQSIPENSIIEQNNCWLEFETVPDLPEGTIYVHTHPYSIGDIQNCPNGLSYVYEGVPGAKDRDALGFWGIEYGLIVDADGLILFNQSIPEDGQQDGERIEPCGLITLE